LSDVTLAAHRHDLLHLRQRLVRTGMVSNVIFDRSALYSLVQNDEYCAAKWCDFVNLGIVAVIGDMRITLVIRVKLLWNSLLRDIAQVEVRANELCNVGKCLGLHTDAGREVQTEVICGCSVASKPLFPRLSARPF
jgi:hypothetical protein